MARPGPGRPLKRVDVHVLLSLLADSLHGYGIVKEIRARTADSVRLEPGNLYRVLRRLSDAGYIEETGTAPTPESDDERRKYYALTEAGRTALRREVARMKDMVAVAEAGLRKAPAEGSGS